MQRIEDGIFFEDSYLGVTLGALVFPHGVIMIDAPLRTEDARSWRSTLINQRGGPNRLLVNMDDHPDRTLGARAIECTIVAHQNTAEVFRNHPSIFKGHSIETGAVWETYNEAIGLRWAHPDIVFSESVSLHWGGPDVILQHRPGPTPGSIWVEIPDANVVYIGDTVLMDQPPFLESADLDKWIESLDLLSSKYRKHIIVSGRGGLVERDHIRAQLRILKKIKKGLEKLADKDASPDATESLLPSLMSGYDGSSGIQELYENRLRHGLYQCFAQWYRKGSTENPSGMENDH